MRSSEHQKPAVSNFDMIKLGISSEVKNASILYLLFLTEMWLIGEAEDYPSFSLYEALYISILGPIVEEFFFRGRLGRDLSNIAKETEYEKLASNISATFSSIVFAAGHCTKIDKFYMGMFFSKINEECGGSLIPSISAHITHNTFCLFPFIHKGLVAGSLIYNVSGLIYKFSRKQKAEQPVDLAVAIPKKEKTVSEKIEIAESKANRPKVKSTISGTEVVTDIVKSLVKRLGLFNVLASPPSNEALDYNEVYGVPQNERCSFGSGF